MRRSLDKLTNIRSTSKRYDRGYAGEPKILSLPRHFLRAMDASNFDPPTGQRTDVAFHSEDGKPIPNISQPFGIRECSLTKTGYRIEWEDGLVSEYTSNWVDTQLRRSTRQIYNEDNRVPWSHWDEAHLRSSPELSIPFMEALMNQEQSLKALYKYGILLVTSTPYDDKGAGIAALASSFSGGTCKTKLNSLLPNYQNSEEPIVSLPHGTDGPLRTLYGTVWSTTSSNQSEGASLADSAYGHESLPLHTDMTYLRDPPGLQVFTMAQPASKGGHSIFADGLFVAEALRHEFPESFRLLSTLQRRYRSIDKEVGWNLEAMGPIIQTNANGDILQIRHNDLDRMPDSSVSDDDIERLQLAHSHLDSILAWDSTRLVMSLRPGDTVVVANQRCFHGRYRFSTPGGSNRVVMGCYVSQDELNSRFRMFGYEVL